MDHRACDAAQEGMLSCPPETNHQTRLAAFLSGLRSDPQWTDQQIDEVAAKIREILGIGAKARAESPTDALALSRREEKVLRLQSLGFTSKEIAVQFRLSPKTIETYKHRGMRKAELGSRAEIVQYALKQGWLVSAIP
jgi:DNA-binding NarL/FixJ family response regulator